MLFCVGIAFYVWDGVRMNSWTRNLPLVIAYAVIVAALFFALRKKKELEDRRNRQ